MGAGLAPVFPEAPLPHDWIPAQNTTPVEILLATVSFTPIALNEGIVRRSLLNMHLTTPPDSRNGRSEPPLCPILYHFWPDLPKPDPLLST
jgi:hypothetical protein